MLFRTHLLALLALVAVTVGCQDKGAAPVSDAGTEPKSPSAEKPAKKSDIQLVTAVEEIPAAKPKPSMAVRSASEGAANESFDAFGWEAGAAEMPVVAMTKHHASTILVPVGGMLPAATLPDLAGQPQSLHKLLSGKLAVVFFWSTTSPRSLEELEDMAALSSRLAERGVKIVSVNLRDTPEAAKAAAEESAVSFPVLLDTDGAYLAQLATTRTTHTYLVDGAGNVLWLDIEYSRPTRRDLARAIHAALH